MGKTWIYEGRRAGAGEGNRTLVVGLGSRCITTMLHPHRYGQGSYHTANHTEIKPHVQASFHKTMAFEG